MTKKWFFFLLIALTTNGFYLGAQEVVSDSSVAVVSKKERIHSPTKATILSALVPGLGQIYNRKYWKLPIVYGAIGTTVYYIKDNHQKMNLFRDEYIRLRDLNHRTPGQENVMDYYLNAVNFYRRRYELSWFSLAGVYVLNILDAAVDAHLFSFDVTEDISLNWQPVVNPEFYGLGIRLNHK